MSEKGREISPVSKSRVAIFTVFMVALAVSIIGVAVYDVARLTRAEVLIRDEFHTVQRMRDSVPLRGVRVRTLEQNNEMESTLDQKMGALLVVNLWATWCRPCIAELPTLQLMQDHYGADALTVVGVSVDPRNQLNDIYKFLELHNLAPIARYHDTYGDVQDAMGQGVLPVTYILTPDGTPLYLIKGEGNWMSKPVLDFMDALLEIY